MNKRSAIVTGSTSGIGLGIARALAGQGVNILLNGFGSREEIEAVRDCIENDFGVRTAFSGADMSKPDEIAEMVEICRSALGSVDILVNNAGIQYTAPVRDFPAEQWDRIIAINLSSNFHAIRAVLPQMEDTGWGRIVNIASAHGLVGSATKSAYVAAKHGVIGLTKVVALETAGTGITCNAVCPGWVLTPLVQKQIDDLAEHENLSPNEASARLLGSKQPSGRFATPQQIGAAVVYLCSEEAAEVRGISLSVDGGWTAQ